METWGLLLLCGGVLAYWLPQYHPFVLPNNDYHSFQLVAESFFIRLDLHG